MAENVVNGSNMKIKIETAVTDLTIDNIAKALAEAMGPEDMLCEEIFKGINEENDEKYRYFTEAEVSFFDEKVVIAYLESAEMGLDGCTTVLEFDKNEKKRLTMLRTGQSHASLCFDTDGNIQQCSYGVPPYCMTFGIYTRKLDIDINENGGTVFVDYIIMLNGRSLERNRLHIEIYKK